LPGARGLEPGVFATLRKISRRRDYVLVAGNEKPALRLDVYAGGGCFLREQATIWNGMVAVGLGTSAFLVDLRTRAATALVVDGYFSDFWSSHEMLLVIDATGIARIEKGGLVKWSSRNLGVDGIEVREVKDGMIFGRGCTDPPESSKSFALSVDTGHLCRYVEQREVFREDPSECANFDK
jgi:hypothetical protein